MNVSGSSWCQDNTAFCLSISFTCRWYDMACKDKLFKHGHPTFLWVGSVIFKLQMAVCGRPLVVFGSLRKERRPHGSWPISLICRRQPKDCITSWSTDNLQVQSEKYEKKVFFLTPGVEISVFILPQPIPLFLKLETVIQYIVTKI